MWYPSDLCGDFPSDAHRYVGRVEISCSAIMSAHYLLIHGSSIWCSFLIPDESRLLASRTLLLVAIVQAPTPACSSSALIQKSTYMYISTPQIRNRRRWIHQFQTTYAPTHRLATRIWHLCYTTSASDHSTRIHSPYRYQHQKTNTINYITPSTE